MLRHAASSTPTLNLAKSKFTPGPAPKSETRTYMADGQAIKASAQVTDPEGKPTSVEWTLNYDGKPHPETGNPDADSLAVKRISPSTTEFTQTKRREGGHQGEANDCTRREDNNHHQQGCEREGRDHQQRRGIREAVRPNVDDAGRTVSFGRWRPPDGVTFMPEGTTVAALARFEATLDSLRETQKEGWVELELAEDRKRVRGRHRQRVTGAAARCTDAGREALRLLGE